MSPISISLLAIALNAGTPAAPSSWVLGQGSADCSGTDVDFSDARHGFASCAFSQIMTTDDGGLNWSVSETSLQQSLLFAHAVSADELYSARLGMYHSTDRGHTWTELGNLSASEAGSVFDAYFAASGRIVAIRGGDVLYSDDSGATWQTGFPAQFPIFPDELHFPSDTVGYATGGITTEQGSSGTVLRSSDGGNSWSILEFTHGEIQAADFFDEDHGVVATLTSEVYTTADGGASWQLLSTLPDNATAMDLVHRDAKHWYIATVQGCLLETYDAGATWQTGYCDPDQRALVAISLRGGAAVAVGNDGIVLYEDRIFRDGFGAAGGG